VGKQTAREHGLKVFLVGRVALEADGFAVQDARLPGRQGRLLFAYLAVERGRPVPRDELAAALWGEAPPATWEKALTVLVSKLRSLLTEAGLDGPRALSAAFGCYRLELPAGTWIDVVAAAGAAGEAERALDAGDPAAAKTAALLAESLTRRAFLPGDNGVWVEDKRRELADTRSRAVTALAGACLRTGAGGEAVSWAQQAIGLEPFRETGYRLLMEAHAADGNRAEALRVYERCRRLLADELGAYPSPETESVYQRLLQAPPAPERPPPERPPTERPPPERPAPERPAPGRPPTAGRGRSRARPRLLAAAALAVVAATGVLTGVAVTSGGEKQVAGPANSVVALDANGSVTTTLPVGTRPVAAVAAAGSLWVANLEDRTVTRIDLSSRRILQSIPIGGTPTALAATPGAVWVSDTTGQISRIDPEYDRPVPTGQLPAVSSLPVGSAWSMLPASGSIWITDPDGYVAQIDLGSGQTTGAKVDVGNEPSAVAAGAAWLWVANSADGTVTRIDPETQVVAATIPVGHGPDAVAVNAAGVWVANAGDDTLVRINPDTDAVAATAPVGDGPAAVLATATALWVANARDDTVMRLDPRSGAVTKTIHLGGSPTALVSAAGRVWVTVAPAPPPPPVAGGTAQFTMQDDFSSLDPALVQDASTVELMYATCANLVTHPDKPGPAGSQIVPEVAEAVPAPTDGGRTYTFTIRSGFRFSPHSNAAVTAQTFKATIERVANPVLNSPFASYFSGVFGYHDYVTGKAPGLSGVVARGDTLTITLSQPDGSFLANLAGGAACAVPSGTPAVPGLPDIPSAGPYYIFSYSQHQQLILRRNPNYHADRPHRLDQMIFTIGVNSARAVSDIEAGTADYVVDGLPADAGPELESRYGPGSKAARAGHQQYFISTADGWRALYMNTSRPLFSNVRLRRAVNYAIDRPALAAEGQRFADDGPFGEGSPDDSYLAPDTTGAGDFHLYPLTGPDLRRARQLAGNVHATAIMYTPNYPPWLQEAQIIQRDLRPLGIDVQLEEFPLNEYYDRIGRRGEPFDLAVSGWYDDTTDPAGDLKIFDGSTISAHNNQNFSYLNDPALDRQLHAAAALSGATRYRTYRQLALELERDLVPAATFATTASRDFFSARMGCQLYQPLSGIDLAALCLRSTGS
jgi:YVTN family beta-propeller protein